MGSSDRLPSVGGDDSSGAADRNLTPVRATFETWQHDSLVKFALEANKRILELEVDRKLLLEAYRELLRRQ